MRQAVSCRRRRAWLGLCALILVALGLASRRPISPFPAVLGNYPGDALWALLVFVLVAFVKPGMSSSGLTMAALSMACLVEAGQLYQAPWIQAIRSTTMGHLVLGNGFDWLDLCAYGVGVGIGYAVNQLMSRRSAC